MSESPAAGGALGYSTYVRFTRPRRGRGVRGFSVARSTQEGEHVIDGTHVPVACTRTGDAAEPAQAPPADLRSALRRGETPSWRFDVQLMPRADIDRCAFDPFDLTKVWPHADYPPRSLGRIVLERDAMVPPLARRPVNRVLPGIGSSPTWPTNIRRAPPTGPRSTPSSASAWRSPSMRSRA
jgi:catalase